MIRNLRAIYARSRLSDQEVRTLRGVVTALTRGRGQVLARMARAKAFEDKAMRTQPKQGQDDE
jgi:tRNA/rRNA methyltransferase